MLSKINNTNTGSRRKDSCVFKTQSPCPPVSASPRPFVFPFAAIIGQDDLKQSLLLNAVNPAIGGVLIRGEKGTAKSTAVRALAAILPEIDVVEGCAYACRPDHPAACCDHCRQLGDRVKAAKRRVRVVNLPLNATEDRVVGGIDFSLAIQKGRRALQPGLLASAHRGILYVDEVNLLDDHIVDIVLDAAASGENIIEREGISFCHPARFILVGTMNPEEGELRPQLLDRFGLCVETTGADSPDDRVTLMLRREAFDSDPAAFMSSMAEQNRAIARRIETGRKNLSGVRMRRHLRSFISELGTENFVAGHRADLVMEQAALAVAALESAPEVTVDHIRQVAPMVLVHRRRDAQPPPPPPPPPPPEDSHEDEDPSQEDPAPENEEPAREQEQQQSEPPQSAAPDPADQGEGENPSPDQSPPQPAPGEDRIFEIGATFKVKPLSAPKDRLFRRGSGRRSRTRVSQKQGRYVKSCLNRQYGDIALDATLRAAAPYQKARGNGNGLCVKLADADIREKIREKRIGNFLLFAVDASGSMGARGRMAASKGAVMSLLLDAYQKRDRVGMISFRRNEATVNLPPTTSVDLAGKLLAEMPVGGRTPLSAGLAKTFEQVRNVLLKDPSSRPIVILITDGKSNVAFGEEKPVDEALRLATAMGRDERVQHIVVDTEEAGLVTFGLALRLATALQARYFKIDDLKAQSLVNIVKGQQQ
ncbi:putative cobaltochelatase [Desulfosarcina ovata]|uniref:Mg-protoporphyrin IX chelatase n=1 Tax=Desulfosarcina ovata subsp. ovata TaxID=2752305 RepID=A0A5K8ALH0_9BACT|nr:putative cobaltochelatase [Desulfosarcina ovata]BBO92444.1 magnesium chelatase [Desulfosarcina ovata subsp. ovata]